MLYYIHLIENTVMEIVPDENPIFPGIPATQRYAPGFVSRCITADDVSSVQTGMIYDPESKTFSDPPVLELVPQTEPATPTPTAEEQLRADVDYLAVMTGVTL